MTKDEKEKSIDRGGLTLSWVRDLSEVCKLLFDAGATEEEVKIILDAHYVPAHPDQDWVNAKRSWYAKTVEGL